MKKRLSEITTVLVALFALAMLSVIPTRADELLLDEDISSGCIRAGVASLFNEIDDVLLEDQNDILTDISNDIIVDEIIEEDNYDVVLLQEEKVETDILTTYASDSDLADVLDENKPSEDKTKGAEKVNMSDVVKAARAVEGSITLTEEEKVAVDMNGNGDVDMGDVVMLAKSVSGSVSE